MFIKKITKDKRTRKYISIYSAGSLLSREDNYRHIDWNTLGESDGWFGWEPFQLSPMNLAQLESPQHKFAGIRD